MSFDVQTRSMMASETVTLHAGLRVYIQEGSNYGILQKGNVCNVCVILFFHLKLKRNSYIKMFGANE